jgi:hypothetical protein
MILLMVLELMNLKDRVEAESVCSEFQREGQRVGTAIGCVSDNNQYYDFIIGYGAGSDSNIL